jgi:hypothetical protein
VADNLLAGREPTTGLIEEHATDLPKDTNENILHRYFDEHVGKGFFSNIVSRGKLQKLKLLLLYHD